MEIKDIVPATEPVRITFNNKMNGAKDELIASRIGSVLLGFFVLMAAVFSNVCVAYSNTRLTNVSEVSSVQYQLVNDIKSTQ